MAFRKFYIDESGTHDGSPVTCVAAYSGRPTEWRKWALEWSRRKKPIEVFHAVDCANLRREFKGWTKERRDEFVAQLLPVIPKYHLLGSVVGFLNEDYERIKTRYSNISLAIENQYEVCLQISILQVLEDLDRLGVGDSVSFVHEDNDYKKYAIGVFDWFRQHSRHSSRIKGYTFATKGEAIPLQAADILAYEGNKRLRNINSPVERRAWRALNPKRSKVGLHYFDEQALEGWLSKLESLGVPVR